MSLMVLSRRSITFRQPGRGEATVLLIPGRDQIQIVKDLAGVKDSSSQSQSSTMRGPQLMRVFSGQRYIYGYLPEEVQELRQAVKVWLAEDFAPSDCQAFFYVFSPEIIVHGVREQSDEGQQSWRTAQLVLQGQDPLRALTNAITDFILANPGGNICVAVLNQLDLYRKLQGALEPYQIAPVPFSTLKPSTAIKPLYKHMDHTLIYLTGLLFGLIVLLASAAFWILNHQKRAQLEAEIQETQEQIRNIQINQSTGHIRRPQSLLDNMAKAFNQQPSAIVDAAASVGVQFGELENINFKPIENLSGDKTPPIEQEVMVSIKNSKDKLLIGQERRAQQILIHRPWVRTLKRTGSVGDQIRLAVTLQTEGAAEPAADLLELASLPVSYTELTDPSITQLVSGTDISATMALSETIVTTATTLSSTTTTSPTLVKK